MISPYKDSVTIMKNILSRVFLREHRGGSDPLWHIDKFIYFDCLSDLDQVLQIDIINELVFIHPLV